MVIENKVIIFYIFIINGMKISSSKNYSIFTPINQRIFSRYYQQYRCTCVPVFVEVRICIHNTESVFSEYTIILIKIIVASKTNKAIIKLSEYSVNIWMNRLFLYTVEVSIPAIPNILGVSLEIRCCHYFKIIVNLAQIKRNSFFGSLYDQKR